MIALDTETTGTNYEKHSLVSVGAVDMDAPENRFYGECRAWEGAHIESEALLINGMTEADVRSSIKQSEAELVTAFLTWVSSVRDHTFCGQNTAFDYNFLRAAAHRGHIDFSLPHRSVDLHSVAYAHIIWRGATPPFDPNHHRTALNADFVFSYTGIPEEPKPHNALTGALCHAEATSRLLYNTKLLPEFSHFSIPWLQK